MGDQDDGKDLEEGTGLGVVESASGRGASAGVVPIRDDSTCLWGSVDIDKYDIDLIDVVRKVEAAKLPLLPCRSKSGGLHLFLFASEPVPAEAMQDAVRSLALLLDFPDSEIFPSRSGSATAAAISATGW